jgi:regulator of sigma E protease
MLVTMLAFLFILAFSITIHEFGHFVTAKLFKIPVEKFSIGYGPPLIRKKIGETDFRIAYFPLGGYVKIAGEDEGNITLKKQETDTEDTENTAQNALKSFGEVGGAQVLGFYDAPIYKRVLIVLAGPLFNIISAFFVFIVALSIYGVFEAPYLHVMVEEGSLAAQAGIETNDSITAVSGQKIADWNEFAAVLEKNEGDTISVNFVRNGSRYAKNVRVDFDSLGISPLVPPLLGSLKIDGPAYRAGMKQGDRVVKIDGKEIENWNQMVEMVRASGGKPIHFTWLHNEVVMQETIKPELLYDAATKDSIWQIGAIMPLQRRYLPVTGIISLAINEGTEIVWLTLKTLYQLLVGRISRRALGGPIAIFRLSGESARWGFDYLLRLLAIISINLGLINLFPIPVLDGGHVVISVVEAVRRKRFSKRTRLIIQQIGYAIILLLIVFVTFNDITR